MIKPYIINYGTLIPIILTAIAAGATASATALSEQHANWTMATLIGFTTLLVSFTAHVYNVNAQSQIAATQTQIAGLRAARIADDPPTRRVDNPDNYR